MDDFDRLGNRLRDLNGEIEKLRREIGGGSGLSPAQLAERLADLSKQELSTRLSLTVMKARSGAIREQIEKIKAQAGANAAENQTLRTLKRIVEVRKSRFEALKEQYAVGVVPKADVDKAEEEMLSAMVEVDRATAAMQKDASQSQLDQLSSELSKAAVDFAEGDARLRFLDDAVAETEKHLIQRHDMDAKADEAQSRLSALERRRSQLQQQRNNAEDTLNSPIDPLQLTLPER
jgi:chromosome segregation ATPase